MMKKVLLRFLLLVSVTFLFVNIKNYKTEIVDSEDLAVYVNDELVSSIPKKGEAMFIKAACDNDGKASWDSDNWGLLVTNMSKKTKCNLYFYSGDTVFNFDYTGTEQVFTVPISGTYKLETWGASGNDNSSWVTDKNVYVLKSSYGLGGYSSGNILLKSNNILYINVGGKSSYNGGGGGEAPGGGATDIRINENNLYSRIMVAAGGGGGLFTAKADLVHRGSAGGLIGYDADALITSSYNGKTTGFSGHGGTQYSGGKTGEYGSYTYEEGMNGSFGKGGEDMTNFSASGGGGGWYGGGHGRHPGASWPGGGGGSSYISGHKGCLAVSSNTSTDLKEGCTSTSNSLECSISYTGYYFTDTLMIDGEGYKWTDKKEDYVGMPSHSDNTTMTGNTGNGYARITLVSIDE